MEELTQLTGGEELDIKYADGREERVKVRIIRPAERKRYLALLNDETASVEFFCGREKGWADTLSADSFDAIADKGQELNLPLFQNFYRRMTERTKALNPGVIEKAIKEAVDQAVAEALAGRPETASPSSSSASPSPSGAG